MPDVPVVFPAIGNTQPAPLPSIESLSGIDAYIKGRQTPTNAGAVAQGITGAIQQYRAGELSDAQVQHLQAQSAGLEAETQLAPYKLQTEQFKAQTEAIKAQTAAQIEPLKAYIDLQNSISNKKKIEYEAKAADLKLKKDQLDFDQSSGAIDAINEATSGNINKAIEKGLKFKSKLFEVSTDLDNDLSGSHRSYFDSIRTRIPQALANNELDDEHARAGMQLLRDYTKQMSQAVEIKKGEYPSIPGVGMDTTPPTPPTPPPAPPTEQPPAPPPSPYGAQGQPPAPTPTPPQQGQLQPPPPTPGQPGEAAEGATSQQPTRPSELQVPPEPSPTEYAGGGQAEAPEVYGGQASSTPTPNPVGVQPQTPTNPAGQAVPPKKKYDVLSMEWQQARLDRRTNEIADRNMLEADPRGRGKNLKVADRIRIQAEARKQATDELKQTQLSPKELDNYTQIKKSAGAYREIVEKGRQDKEFLEDYAKKYGVASLAMGPGATLRSYYQKGVSALTPGYDELVNAKNNLHNLSGMAGLAANVEFGGSTKTADTPPERRMASGISITPDVDYAKFITAWNFAEGKAQELEDTQKVIDGLMYAGESYDSAMLRASAYKDRNPGTIPGKLSAKESGLGREVSILVPNPNRQSPQQFLEDIFSQKITTPGNDVTQGRVVGASTSSASADFVYKFTKEDGTLDSASLSHVIRNVSSRDIPENAPNGAPETLMYALMRVENQKADPNAVNIPPSGAKATTASGLFQLLDGTGKEVWDALGLSEGNLGSKYNPFNAHKNAAMAIKYLNQQLDHFRGDVRTSLAAWKVGPTLVGNIYDSLELEYGRVPTWGEVASHLPVSRVVNKETGETINVQSDAVSFVGKVMRDRDHPTTPNMPRGTNYDTDIAPTLPPGRAQEFSKTQLTPRAKEEHLATMFASNVEETKPGTAIGDVARSLANYVMGSFAGEAVAEEPPAEGQGGQGFSAAENETMLKEFKAIEANQRLKPDASEGEQGSDFSFNFANQQQAGRPLPEPSTPLTGEEQAAVDKFTQDYPTPTEMLPGATPDQRGEFVDEANAPLTADYEQNRLRASVSSPPSQQAPTPTARPKSGSGFFSALGPAEAQAEEVEPGAIPPGFMISGKTKDGKPHYVPMDPGRYYAVQSAVMGASRALTFGGDIWAASHLISMASGRPYEEVKRQLQATADALYENYPGYYIGGAIAGSIGFGGPAARLAEAPVLAVGRMLGIAGKAAPAVPSTAGWVGRTLKPPPGQASQTMVESAKRSIPGAVGGGAAQGALEAPVPEDATLGEAAVARLEGGLEGAAYGAAFGPVIAATGYGVGKAGKALIGKYVNSPAEVMNPGQADIALRYKEVKTPSMQAEEAIELAPGANPRRPFMAGTTAAGKTTAIANELAQIPGEKVSGRMQETAEGLIQSREPAMRATLAREIPEFAQAQSPQGQPGSKMLAKSVEGTLSRRGKRLESAIKKEAGATKLPKDSSIAHRALARLAVQMEDRLYAKALKVAKPYYDAAQNALTDLKSKPNRMIDIQLSAQQAASPTAGLNQGMSFTYKRFGQSYRRHPNLPKVVKGYEGAKFEAMIKRDPIMSQALYQASREVGGGVLPANEYRVVRRAIRILGRMSKEADGHEAGVSYNKLRNATIDPKYGGTPLMKVANDIYYDSMEKVRAMRPVVNAVKKFANLGNDAADIIKKLLSMDPTSIRYFKAHVPAKQKDILTNSLLSHMRDLYQDLPGKRPGKLQKFPELSAKVEQKIKMLLGPQRASRIFKAIEKQRRLEETLSGLNTTKDPAGYALSLELPQLGDMLDALTKQQKGDLKAAFGEYVMKQIRAQGSPTPTRGQLFPQNLQGLEDHMRMILGDRATENILKDWATEAHIGEMTDVVRKAGARMKGGLEDSNWHNSNIVRGARLARGVLNVALRRFKGIPQAQLDFASALQGNKVALKQAEEMSDIIFGTSAARREFLRKDIANRLKAEGREQDVKHLNALWDYLIATGPKAMERLAIGAATDDPTKAHSDVYLNKKRQMQSEINRANE